MAPERGTSPVADAGNGEVLHQRAGRCPVCAASLLPVSFSESGGPPRGGSRNPRTVARTQMKRLARLVIGKRPHASVRLRPSAFGRGELSQGEFPKPGGDVVGSGRNCASSQLTSKDVPGRIRGRWPGPRMKSVISRRTWSSRGESESQTGSYQPRRFRAGRARYSWSNPPTSH